MDEFFPWYKTWFVIIFGFVSGKMKVLKCPLSRKWDFSLHDYMFDKYEGWVCPSMSLEANNGIFTYLVLNSVNKRYWDDPCRENEILAYMVANFINEMDEFFPWFKTWFVILFGRMKVLKSPMSRKWDFSLYDYMFDKYEGWACPSMSLEANNGIFTYLVLNSVNKRYWDDPCRQNEILAYMVTNLINEKIEFVPWFKTWFMILFGFVFG